MIGRAIKAVVCTVAGLLTAEGICIVGNALAEDLSRAKSGFDVVINPTLPEKNPKKGWGRK